MSIIQRGKLLRISSEDKQPGESNSDFTVIINNVSYIQNVRGIVPTSISFKHTFPNIFSGNNTFSYVYDGNPSSVTIAEGWYTTADLVTAINAELALDVTITGSVVMAYVDAPTSTTKKFQFTSDLAFTALNKTNGNAMSDELGVGVEQTGLVTVMTYIPDLGGINTIYLCSTQLADANSAASSNNGENVPVLVQIPVNAPYGGQINYRANAGELESVIYASGRQMTQLRMTLCTRTGATLELGQFNLIALFKIIPNNIVPID
jgi:hypothetical protein